MGVAQDPVTVILSHPYKLRNGSKEELTPPIATQKVKI